MQSYSAKDPGDTVTLSWDFSSVLASGEAINTYTWEITDPESLSSDFSSMLSGSPTLSGNIVSQDVTAGQDGTSYRYRITTTTSLNHVYVEKPTQLVTSE